MTRSLHATYAAKFEQQADEIERLSAALDTAHTIGGENALKLAKSIRERGILSAEVSRKNWALKAIQANYTKRGFIKRVCSQALEERASEDQTLVDTVKERIADPKIVDVNLEDLVSTEQTPVSPNTATEKDSTQNGNKDTPHRHITTGDVRKSLECTHPERTIAGGWTQCDVCGDKWQ